MKHSAKYGLFVIVVISIYATIAFAAPTKGIPPFQSFGGGPDVINLGNLNVHYSFPVFSRAGRGIPFSYALAYDSSVWTPAGSVWSFAGSGLTLDVAAAVGVTPVAIVQRSCIDHSNGQRVYYNMYTYSSYTDSAGTIHRFPSTSVIDANGDVCTFPVFSATVSMSDGSGMTITVDNVPSAVVVLRSGEKINTIVSGGGSSNSSAQTDSNGNQITSSTTAGVTSFYDTLSSTTRVLQISVTAPSPVSYTYTGASGSATAVVVTYATYSVQTNFACAVNQYGPISNSLVDKITLPD